MSAATSRRLLCGWGRAGASAADVARPEDPTGVVAALGAARSAGRVAIARGLGRAYGDAAQCGGGTVLDCTGLDGMLSADLEAGRVRVGAGTSLADLLATVVPAGWFLPVTPGTAAVTIGGALAADVHGKNHHRDGSFGGFVEQVSLAGPDGVRVYDPTEAPDAFFATVGGMGLTGVVTEVTLRLQRIETALMAVETRRAADIDECMALLSAEDAHVPYSVAWVDGVARGGRLGRAVVTLGRHATLGELPAAACATPLERHGRRRLPVPFAPPVNLVGPGVVAAFNEAYFRRAPRARTSLETIDGYFYPLDALADWNRLYGPRGFTQYQFVVPLDAADVVRRVLEHLQQRHKTPTLVVLKRFGVASRAPLSFPMPGWTAAIDLATGNPGLAAALDELDELVAAAGGRVYLAKDGRLRPDLVAAMYPRLDQWRATRAKLDPDGLFASDLARRLHLTGPDGPKRRRG